MIISKYNYWKNEVDVELFPGEEICPKCDGSGIKLKLSEFLSKCPKCMGNGKLDWISKLMK